MATSSEELLQYTTVQSRLIYVSRSNDNAWENKFNACVDELTGPGVSRKQIPFFKNKKEMHTSNKLF